MSDLYTRFRMTDIAAWPKAVQSLAWRMPWKSLAVSQVLGTGLWQTRDPLPDTAAQDLMPKLAIKSWQESGRLRRIPQGLPLADALAARLSSPTAQQRVVLRAWEDADTPPLLHLFPWADMQNVTEARFLWSGGKLSWVSTCQRNAVQMGNLDFSQAGPYIADHMPRLGSFIVQFAVPEHEQVRIIDINPALSRTDLDDLEQAAA